MQTHAPAEAALERRLQLLRLLGRQLLGRQHLDIGGVLGLRAQRLVLRRDFRQQRQAPIVRQQREEVALRLEQLLSARRRSSARRTGALRAAAYLQQQLDQFVHLDARITDQRLDLRVTHRRGGARQKAAPLLQSCSHPAAAWKAARA